jgi:hypothetical protein
MQWFTLISKELHDSAIVQENVYNMNETGVLLNILSSLKVLISKEDLTNYKRRRSQAYLSHGHRMYLCRWEILSDPPTNDCGGAVAVANIGYTEVAERIRPDRTKVANSDECLRPDRLKVANSDEYLYRCSFPHQLDRQAIQHLLRLTDS